ncbi:hypothetical protein ACFL0H_09570 [Thermodesulfobacteriota bacterium]
MTEKDKSKTHQLTERQLKSIPHLVAAPTFEEGRKNARVSRNALYEWLKNPVYKKELKRARDLVVSEALEILKGNITQAVETLVDLLSTADSESLKRSICNDIINYTLRARELGDIEERLTSIERIVLERRVYR